MKMLAFSLSQFYDTAKTAKKVFTQADRALEISSFTNMVAIIEIDALKV